MELTLEIVSFQKSLMGDGRSCAFDETGGSIGRARDNTWVLPDPNRYVSSRHAEIDFVDGRFRLTDTSTNGVFVNGDATAVGRDGQVALSDGDHLVIGDYEIAVRLSECAASPMPAAPVVDELVPMPRHDAPPPQDILDVVSRRRSEPRLGHPTIPDDPLDADRPVGRELTAPPREAAPSAAPLPAPPLPDRPPAMTPAAVPMPPPPPRPAARERPQPVAPTTIPDDDDLMPSVLSRPAPPPITTPNAAPPPRPAPPRPAAPPVGAAPAGVAQAGAPQLPDDFDDLLPDPPAAGLPKPSLPELDLPDLDLPGEPAADPEPQKRGPAIPSPAPPPVVPIAATPPAKDDVLPAGVPLVDPVPGTGNRQEPLSPPPATPSAAHVSDDALESPSAQQPPPMAKPTASMAPADAPMLVAALADGLGIDPRDLDGLDPRATVALAARAARTAALGISEAYDVRNALARVAGIDPRDFDDGEQNPFLVYRSGEAALKHAVTSADPDSMALDDATRASVAALTVTAAAATSGLEAVLDRFAAGNAPRSSAEVREIFGEAFLNAYHRETSRQK